GRRRATRTLWAATSASASLCAAAAAAAPTAALVERRRPHQEGLDLRSEDFVQFLTVVHELDCGAAVRVAIEIGKHVVDEPVVLQLDRPAIGVEELFDRLRFS